jgi:phospholipase C
VGGNSDDWYDGRPIGLGPRVPMTIVSPWTVGGHVHSEVSDHTSVVQLLEKVTGVEEPNISTWRRSTCGDLTGAFDFEVAGEPPELTQPGPVPAPVARWRPEPPADQTEPVQEKGRRPARALPYRTAASARLLATSALAVRVADGGTQGAPFAVYSYAAPSVPEHVFVPAGSHVTTEVPVTAGGWDVAVQGPNRFWYEAAGTVTGAAGRIDVRTKGLRTGALEVRLVNDGDDVVTLDLTSGVDGTASESVRLDPGQVRVLSRPTDHGWYDVVVTAREDESFRRRVTGRVETGRPGVTPA